MSAFADDVQDALAHLFDPVYLQTHALTRYVRSGAGSSSAARLGAALRLELVEAINSLRPMKSDGPPGRANRGHQILTLRYVDALDPITVQGRIGLGKSTYYIEHKRAVEAVTSLLAARWGMGAAPSGEASAPVTPADATGEATALTEGASPAISQPLTSFVGREWELAALRGMLAATAGVDVTVGGGRLVTLTGPAGIGKTRLALRTASLLSDEGRDVRLVELAPLDDAVHVLPAIAQRLGLREAANTPVLRQLIDRLAGSDCLLVLDNFEQVMTAAPAIGELLRACPQLSVLVTSREALRVQGERELPVPPLQLPQLNRHATEPRSAAQLAQYEAVQLFAERARAIDPTFALGEENTPAVLEICARLDGLPLAIELAAVRTRVLSPAQMLPRLERRLAILTGGARDVPSRQQTLRGAIAWSYDLLSDDERTLFRWLSAFGGGWTLEAAEAVCGGVATEVGAIGLSVLDGLESLLAKNLVRRPQRGEQGGEGERLMLLEIIREYAGERLEEDAARDRLRDAHARYYLGLAEEAERQLVGSDQGTWLDRLNAEQGNLRLALTRLASVGASDEALRLAASLRQFWVLRGEWSRGQEWLMEALSLAGPSTSEPRAAETQAARAKALHAAAHLAGLRGEAVAAQPWCEEALALWRSLGNREGVAACLYTLATTAFGVNESGRARPLYRDALAAYRALGHEERVAAALSQLGLLEEMEGQYAQAQALQEESLAIRRRRGDASGIANALNNLGNLARTQERLDDAARYYGEALALCRDLGHRLGMATLSLNLALVLLARGEQDGAAPLLHDAVGLYRDLDYRRGLAWCVPAFAWLAEATEDMKRAATLFGAASVLLEAQGAQLSPAERATYDARDAAVRDRMRQDSYRELYESGRALTLERAMRVAINHA